MKPATNRAVLSAIALLWLVSGAVDAVVAGGLTIADVARLRDVSAAEMSPDGGHVAYALSVPRAPYKDEDGKSWSELWVADAPGVARPYVTGQVTIGEIRWTPDGSHIGFLTKRGDDKHKSLYLIPLAGGEARRRVQHGEDITAYSFSPDGTRVAFLAKPKQDKREKTLKKKGFKAEVYEENWRPVRVWIASLDWATGDGAQTEEQPRALELDGSASELHWSPAADLLAVALAPTSLIDDHYMSRKLHLVDVADGKSVRTIDTPGKLGKVVFSPDGARLAILSAEDRNDPSAGRLMVATVAQGELKAVLPGYEGDVVDFGWQDDDTVMYLAHEGVESLLVKVDVDGSGRKTLVAPAGRSLSRLSLAADGLSAALRVDAPAHPSELYVMRHGEQGPTRWTDSNPWLAGVELARQEVVRYPSRDGLEIEGLLIRPLNEKKGQRYPLIVVVHGGPESHFSNGWNTNYSRPGQFAAAAGYAVVYPNYRGSTGRGVAFSKLDQADYGGAEFDDLVDAVEHLVESGLVDRARVGVTGGSYGGYAAAWCATALTEHFAAAVMFVGISDQISKFGTTDIPLEMYEVHARRWPWEHWDWFRERSPIFHTENARTPILIMHGKDDTRVHPSQSMELYRYLRTIGKVPVRLVLYPGEAHGNRHAAARLDYSRRLMRWMGHYLQGAGGEPPPYELEHADSDLKAGADDDDKKEESTE